MKKEDNPVEQWTKNFSRCVIKEDFQMVNKLIKKLPTSLVIKGMQTEIPG